MNDMHDHGSMTHSMNCPVCQAQLSVHAHDDEEAVRMLMQEGMKHMKEAGHPEDPSMTPEMMEKMTRESMKKAM